MQALKLSLSGRFWDSHIYSGRLYLFDRLGAVRTVNWDGLIDNWRLPPELTLAMQCAFSRSDYLYGGHWTPMFRDIEVKPLIVSKFDRLAGVTLQCDEKQWSEHLAYEQDSPFPFPHTDARIYSRVMYVSADSGLYHSNCGTQSVRGVSRRVTKDWDCPALALATYSNTLAIAAGDEGLFEKRIGDTWWQYADQNQAGDEDVQQVVNAPCGSCEWTYYSIFGSSHETGGFLASFEIDRDSTATASIPPKYLFDLEQEGVPAEAPPSRRFDSVLPSDQLFHGHGFSWASRDKIYQAGPSIIRAIRYQPWNEDINQRFIELPAIQLAAWKGDVVSAGVAVFGTIIECDSCLLVVLSDGSVVTIPGEPVRWRVFPRSKHYENQLHVIYEDRLEVWSFNHDYFVDQASKVAGLQRME